LTLAQAAKLPKNDPTGRRAREIIGVLAAAVVIVAVGAAAFFLTSYALQWF
jgi:hypothetical protein